MEMEEESTQMNQIAETLLSLQSEENKDASIEIETLETGAPDGELKFPSQGTVIFRSEVEIFFVNSNSSSATPKQLGTRKLVVVKLPVGEQSGNQILKLPHGFIQVDDWIYSLVPNQSSVYKSSDGYFIFPDLKSEVLGDSVVIVFGKSIPEYKKRVFEQILRDTVRLLDAPDELSVTIEEAPIEFPSPVVLVLQEDSTAATSDIPPEDLPKKVKEGFLAAAELTRQGLSLGVNKTVDLIQKGTSYVKEYAAPASDPNNDGIEPGIKQVIEFSKEYTGKMVELGSYAANRLTATTATLASKAGSFLHSSATQTLSQVTGRPPEEVLPYFDSFSEIAEGAVGGMSLVYKGINDAAKSVGSSIAANSIDVIDHWLDTPSYGPDFAQIAEETAETVANVIMIGLEANSVNPKKLMTRAAKEVSGAVLSKTQSQDE